VSRQDPGRAIDIGCNDGSLLEALRRAGYAQVVGVEPNPVAASIARNKGHQVYTSYLTKELASQIVADCGAFDTVYLRHVVEHVSDLEAFFGALRVLLRPDGLLVLELPDVEEGFALGSPAILWEEHVSYFTQALAEYLLERFGFHISDRRRYVFGGGSLALLVNVLFRSEQSRFQHALNGLQVPLSHDVPVQIVYKFLGQKLSSLFERQL
jgi:SAM-dependent methyltransferase